MQQSFLLGLKILERRKALKMTQVELGKRIGVSGGAISQFEKAVNKPTEQTLKKLSEILAYDFEFLLSNTVPTNSEQENQELGTYSGNFIEQARKRKNLSQAQLAELVGVSRASISLYETGAGDPSYKVLGKLAEVLDFSFPTLASMVQDHYSTVMLTREGFDEMNIIRSSLIKELFNREEKYVEVEFLLPSTLGKPTPEQNHNYMDASKAGMDFTLGIDPYRVFDGDVRWPTVSVLAIPGVDYTDAGIYIVRDNKMGARYPEKSRHVLHPIIDDKQWSYLTGLHGFLIKGNTIIIRRIVSNKNNFLDLADANGNVISVIISDITRIWRVGQTIHMPADE
jgi:transcriptional regulator with XRE-family HTH domain